MPTPQPNTEVSTKQNTPSPTVKMTPEEIQACLTTSEAQDKKAAS